MRTPIRAPDRDAIVTIADDWDNYNLDRSLDYTSPDSPTSLPDDDDYRDVCVEDVVMTSPYRDEPGDISRRSSRSLGYWLGSEYRRTRYSFADSDCDVRDTSSVSSSHGNASDRGMICRCASPRVGGSDVTSVTSLPAYCPTMEYPLKVLVIGDAGVGKTSYVKRYVARTYDSNYRWTVGVDFALKVVKWSDDVTIKLQLWDIAGQERFSSMTRVYYRDAQACIIMFDLTQKSTFDNTLKWKKDLDSKCCLDDGGRIPCILLANKCDLGQRDVEQQEIETFCRENNFIGWTDTSVKDNLMIRESMRFLLDDTVARIGVRNPELAAASEDRNSSTVHLRAASPNDVIEKKCAC